MQKCLEGKVALVTGGTRGIGRAIVERFLEQGARVAFVGTNQERGEKVVQELGLPKEHLRFYAANLASPEAIETMIEAVYADFSAIDILVNNAGITRDGLLMRMKPEDWEAVLQTNLTSIYHTCRHVIRGMMKARFGKVINITSVVGIMGNAGQTNYAASKAGMIGFSKSLAKEVASRGICVNCIAPGFIESDMTAVLNEKQKAGVLGQIPMQKLGQGGNIADAALFLASPLADYVTGQVLNVDGGMLM